MVHEGDSKVEIKVPKYRDFSSVPCPKGEQQQEEVAPRRTRIGRQPKNFVVQLHSILDELENDGLDTIACWQPHGRAFIVKNADELVSRILSKRFDQNSIHSFNRQLKSYGFKRIGIGLDKGAFYHERFLRGKRFLCYSIQRLSKGSTGFRKKTCTIELNPELNFYAMPYLPRTTGSPKSSPLIKSLSLPADNVKSASSKDMLDEVRSDTSNGHCRDEPSDYMTKIVQSLAEQNEILRFMLPRVSVPVLSNLALPFSDRFTPSVVDDTQREMILKLCKLAEEVFSED